jgi:hypothetical protein
VLRQRRRADLRGHPALVTGKLRELRDELLNETLFTSLAHARVAL